MRIKLEDHMAKASDGTILINFGRVDIAIVRVPLGHAANIWFLSSNGPIFMGRVEAQSIDGIVRAVASKFDGVAELLEYAAQRENDDIIAADAAGEF